MKRLLFLFLLILPCLSFAPMHKFYVSVTEMEFKHENNSVQIISRIFINDFETVLNTRYGTEFFLASKKENEKTNSFIQKYIFQKLKIEINGEEMELQFLGKEYENDMVLLYIEIANVEQPKIIKVKNEMLLGLFPEQKNIVHFETEGETKSLLLHRAEESGTLNF